MTDKLILCACVLAAVVFVWNLICIMKERRGHSVKTDLTITNTRDGRLNAEFAKRKGAAEHSQKDDKMEAHAHANLYLQVTDAMGYTSGKDGMEFSPEEWGAALLADANRYRWLRDHAAYSDNVSFNYNDGVRSFIFQGPATDGYIDDAMTHHSRNTA